MLPLFPDFPGENSERATNRSKIWQILTRHHYEKRKSYKYNLKDKFVAYMWKKKKKHPMNAAVCVMITLSVDPSLIFESQYKRSV